MKKFIICLMVLFCLSSFAFGDEGMWMLNQVKNLNLMKLDFKISASDIYSPDKPCITNAIVLLGGGTSEFVSPKGLLLTNHHVAFTAVQRASTKGKDFITQGFLAQTLEEEIEAPGYSAQILKEMKDVTHKFARFNKIKDPEKQKKAIDRKITEMTEKIEKGRSDINAVIAKMYNGKQYILYVYDRFDDVRVVYVPPKAIGNYGGDIDNWMWPRHTGDFSFMRVYMAPDGTGRKYHKDNIPYKPRYWLKVAKEGLKNGDQTCIMGFPGRTVRYRTSHSVVENLNHTYAKNIKYFKEVIELLEKFSKDSKIAKAKLAGLDAGLNNAMKYYQGMMDGMKNTNFVQKKIDFENGFAAFLKKDQKMLEKFGDVLPKIKKQYEMLAKFRNQDDVLNRSMRLSGTVFGIARDIYFTSKEREKSRKQRDPKFSEKDIKRKADRLHFKYMSFYEPADKALLLKALKTADHLTGDQRINGFDSILKNKSRTVEKIIDEAYKKTNLKDPKFAKGLYFKKSRELEALNDPFINLAKSIYQEREASRKRNERFGANILTLRKRYIDALYAWKGSHIYPDANRTIRFSYGRVEGYEPRDAVDYKPFTYIKGMLEKDTGKVPFNMPQGVKDLYKKKDFGRWTYPGINDVPIAFLHKVDSTGGNSGSPVLNSKGEIVGILFDGNYESMTGDWLYEPEIQRSISVDIRFVMFITEKLAKAEKILKEMHLN